MKATLRQVDGVMVVDMSGRITLGEGCTQLRELVRDQLGKGTKHLLLNLADVTYIDSSGIGELVRFYHRSNQRQVEAAQPDQESSRSL
jgi:anti-sigma B factor antagonist